MSVVRFHPEAPCADVAHLVERHLAKVEVAGSSPVIRSNLYSNLWRYSQVVRQRSAKPLSPVRIWVAPPVQFYIVVFAVRCMNFGFIYGMAIFYIFVFTGERMLINIGFGNSVSSDKIVAILSADSSPVKRLTRTAKSSNSLIDATCGRKTQSVLVMDSDHVVLSALSSDVISSKYQQTG